MVEIWRPIPGFRHYQASTEGRVRRDPAHATAQVTEALKPSYTGGYAWVTIAGDGAKRRKEYVHRLVCLAFHGPPPTPRHEVAHRNGVRPNTKPDNLRWSTRKDNHADKKEHGTYINGEQMPWARLKSTDIPVIRDLLAHGMSCIKIGEQFGVSNGCINNVRVRRTWAHVP